MVNAVMTDPARALGFDTSGILIIIYFNLVIILIRTSAQHSIGNEREMLREFVRARK